MTSIRGFCIMVTSLSTSSSDSSPALLFMSISAFFKQMLENLRPTPLMDVIAYMILVFPSMFVFITRRICWNWFGTTKDILLVLVGDGYDSLLYSFTLISVTICSLIFFICPH